MAIYLTRGYRQSSVDVWVLISSKPVLVRGNWKHSSAPDESKDFWLPFETIQQGTCKALYGKVPEPGKCLKVTSRKRRSA